MKIVDLIQHQSIIPSLRSQEKAAVVDELANHLARIHESISSDEIAKILHEREGIASTAIGEGVAIPHGKLPELDRIVACLGRAENGIDFGSGDGQPTYLFFVLVAPSNCAGNHLRALARISRVFNDASFRHRLQDAGSAEDMYAIIEEEELKH